MKHRSIFVVVALLLFIGVQACGSTAGKSPTTSSGSQEVQVTETEYKIDSSVTSFVAGQTYHFVVKNLGSIAHEFMIMPKSEGPSMSGMDMGNMDKMALAMLKNIAP